MTMHRKELRFNMQGQSPSRPDVGPSELLEDTISSSYAVSGLSV